jgi:uncharacterized protein (TIGR00266 family)
VQHIVKHSPTFPLLEVTLAPDETLVAEAGTMVARSPTVTMDVRLNAPQNAGFWEKLQAFLVALARKIVGGDTLFVNHFRAPSGGFVWLAPAMSGALHHVSLSGQSLLLSAGAYVASIGPINLEIRWGGLKAILSREGAFFVEATGKGDLWLTAYGAIEEIEVNGTYVVDSGHVVAFDSRLQYQIKNAGGGLVGLFASGEGLVLEFTGQGKVLVQTRNRSALVGWVSKLLP